jgi:hypothetical protein
MHKNKQWTNLILTASALIALGGLVGCGFTGNNDEEIVVIEGPPGLNGLNGQTGPAGPAGPAGADGQLRIYGDGSAGAFTVTSSDTLNNLLTAAGNSQGNLQFTNFTVNGGQTLTVPSGTKIRCTGTFINNGAIVVSGFSTTSGSSQLGSGPQAAASGASFFGHQSRQGDQGALGTAVRGGQGGQGASVTAFQPVLNYDRVGGGSGAAGFSAPGGIGGGTLMVLAQNSAINNGAIVANGGTGDAGAGGGGGGFVTLASAGSVVNGAAASIQANGAAGTPSDPFDGVGAPGGGGLIQLLAPTVTNSGSTSVFAGTLAAPGAAGSVNNANGRVGGGGGGGSVGRGGFGGDVTDTNSPLPATSALPGIVITSTQNPTALFRMQQ